MRIRVSRWQSAGCNLLLSGLLFCSVSSFSQIATSSSALNFGGVQVGSSSSLAVTVSNTSKTNLTVSEATISGSGFSITGLTLPLSLAPRQSANLLVSFAPQITGSANGTLTVATQYEMRNGSRERSNTMTILLSGTATATGYLSPSLTNLNFGNTLVGNSQTLSVALTNSGGSPVSIAQAAVAGSGFSLGSFAVPATVAAGQSVTLTVAFTPAAAGTSSGTLTVTSNASDPAVTLSLSGNGTSLGQIGLSPTSLSFGTVDLGATETLSGTITATGSSVTISSVTSSSSQFSLSGVTLPLTIAVGQSAPFSITFAPQASGTASGSFSFLSNASNSPSTETVGGTGQTVQYTVSLSWNASTSGVSGYNVYRSTTSGGPYTRLDSSLDVTTTYADSTVQSGQTYFYVTAAVNSSGIESSYSNQVSAQIPTP